MGYQPSSSLLICLLILPQCGSFTYEPSEHGDLISETPLKNWPKSTNNITISADCSSHVVKFLLHLSDHEEQAWVLINLVNKDLSLMCWSTSHVAELRPGRLDKSGLCGEKTVGAKVNLTLEWTEEGMKLLKGEKELISREWGSKDQDGYCLNKTATWRIQNYGSIGPCKVGETKNGSKSKSFKSSCDCALGWLPLDKNQQICRKCKGSDNCEEKVSAYLDNIDMSIESDKKDDVIAWLEEVSNSGLLLSPKDARHFFLILSSTKDLLGRNSKEEERLHSVMLRCVEFLKTIELKFADDHEKSEIINIIEAVSKSLTKGKSISTTSIFVQSILPRKDQPSVELNAPKVIPKEDLPIKLLFGSQQGITAKVATIDEAYKEMLPKPHVDNTFLVSPIVSVNFEGPQSRTRDKISFSLVFQRKEHPNLTGYNVDWQCVYLNTTVDKWLHDGCTQQLNSDGTITCTWTHTTSFAVLLSPTEISDHRSQGIASYVMSVVNLIFLILTFCLIAPFKHLRKKQLMVIQLSLILTLILGYFSFGFKAALAEVTVDESGNPLLSLNAGCVAGVIISQYFFLSAFFWMGSISWTLFNKIGRAVETYGKIDIHYYRKCAVISWIGPIFLPLAALLFSLIPDDYSLPYVGAERKNGTHCWVEEPWSYIGFLVPAYIILLLNCVSFGVVARVIAKTNARRESREVELAKTAKAMLVVAVSVGLPWIVAGLAVGPIAEFMQYLFIVLTGLQGPVLFVALIIFQEEARKHSLKLMTARLSSHVSTSSQKEDTAVLSGADGDEITQAETHEKKSSK